MNWSINSVINAQCHGSSWTRPAPGVTPLAILLGCDQSVILSPGVADVSTEKMGIIREHDWLTKRLCKPMELVCTDFLTLEQSKGGIEKKKWL